MLSLSLLLRCEIGLHFIISHLYDLEMKSQWSRVKYLKVGKHFQELLLEERKVGYEMGLQTNMRYQLTSSDATMRKVAYAHSNTIRLQWSTKISHLRFDVCVVPNKLMSNSMDWFCGETKGKNRDFLYRCNMRSNYLLACLPVKKSPRHAHIDRYI